MAANKKPTNLKILEGNPGKRPLSENEVKPKEILPKCPVWLNKEAKKKFKQLSKILYNLGLLTELDIDMLVMYCQDFSTYKECQINIKENGLFVKDRDNNLRKNPYISILNQVSSRMVTHMSKFGMSPSDRVGLEIDIGENKKEKTGIKKYLSGI